MGQFFTNLQVRAGEVPVATLRPRIAARIRERMRAEGLHEVADPAQAQRSIHLAVGEGDWLAVYDSASEDQDDAVLAALAAALSVDGRTAIGILVHDGDVLQMRVYRDGAAIDALDSWPGYFDGRMPVVEPHDFEAWRDLPVEGADVEALSAAWRTDRLAGALPLLARIAAVLGMDPLLCTLGADSLAMAEQIDAVSLHFSA